MKIRLLSALGLGGRAPAFYLLLLTVLLGLAPPAARAQKVGIGTTAPTQTLDVNGALRVRGLSGTDLRLPQVLPDGTLTVGSVPLFGSTPTVATPLDTVGVTPGYGNRVFRPVLADGLLYVPADQLRIYNVQNPAAPVLVGAATVPETFQVTVTTVGARKLAVVSDFTNNALYVVDVSNPAAPVLLSTASPATDDGQASAIVSKGNIVFVASAADPSPALARLAIWDLSNPASPVRRSSVGVGGTDQMALSASGTTLYVADNQSQLLRVLNVSNPAAPVQLSATPSTVYTMGFAVSGTTLYQSGYGGTLHTLDVSNPAAPRELASIAVAAGDVAVAGPVAAVTDVDGHRLQLVDVRNPAAPVLRGTTPAPSAPRYPPYEFPGWVATDGTTAYVSIDMGGRIETYNLAGAPRAVVVGADGSLGSAPAPTLSVSGQQLSIAGGNTVTLPSTPTGNLGNHTATQNLNLAGNLLVGGTAAAPGSSGLGIGSGGNVGIGLAAGAAASRLHVYNATSFDVARLESNSVGPHLQLIKSGGGGTGVVDYIGTDFTGFRAGALELRGASSVQLSGDGDPSSPDLVVMANGNVGIGTGTTAPYTRLDVNGTARATAVLSPTTGSHNLLPVAYGAVGSAGNSLASTDNYTLGRLPGTPTGGYRITFTSTSGLNATDLSNVAVTATLFGTTPGFITYRAGTGTVDVYTFNSSGTATDRGFSFTVHLP